MSNFLVVRQGDSERWTLNDPATRNALSDAMVVALFEACLRAKADDRLRTVVLTGAGEVVFAGLEQRQHIVPRPARIAFARPTIVVACLAAHVDHAVDRRAAAQHLAPWITQAATTQAALCFGLEAPVGARVTDAEQVTDRNVNPRIVVAPAGFEQQHALLRIRRQSIGQQAPGRAGADHDVVVFIKGSLHSLTSLFVFIVGHSSC